MSVVSTISSSVTALMDSASARMQSVVSAAGEGDLEPLIMEAPLAKVQMALAAHLARTMDEMMGSSLSILA